MSKKPQLPYILEPQPLGEGGQATVFRATHRQTGEQVALKRSLKRDQESLARLRREIEVQGALQHLHIMPLLDTGSQTVWGYNWYTMPLADTVMAEFQRPLDNELLLTIVQQCAFGLAAAHEQGVIHRDVKPQNIMHIITNDSPRWVISDWGLVRRPLGLTTITRTQPGQFLGTEAFAAPEMWDDAHNVGPTCDIFSLGRVIAWALDAGRRGQFERLPAGPWRQIVQAMTAESPARRPQNMHQVLELLDLVRHELRPGGIERLASLLEAAQNEDLNAAIEICRTVSSYPEQSDLFLDYLARIPQNATVHLVESDPLMAEQLVQQMQIHLTNDNWGNRDFNYANVPLGWLHNVAIAAAQVDNLGVFEDAVLALFTCEVKWRRFKQRDRTRRWLQGLRGNLAQTVARLLRQHPEAIDWYREDDWRPAGADLSLQTAFVQPAS